MKTHNVLGICCCALGSLPVAALAQDGPEGKQKSTQPNIILIMTDQQRSDAMGCSGNPAIMTPHLDGLAADGYRFTAGYSSCPSSTPARAGLLTGMSPWHHGMLGYGNEAEEYPCESPTILKGMGYYTATVGKNHWYPQWNRHGLDFLMSDESGRELTEMYKSDYRKWFALQAPGVNPESTGIGWNEHGSALYKLDERLHPTVWTGQTAVEFIHHYKLDKPLFLKVSFARPHSPYDPPKRVYDLYENMPSPEAPAHGDWVPESWREPSDPIARPEAAIGNFGDEYAINSLRHNYASITFVDEQIGQIIEALKEEGMYDNSLIFFISDHGDMMGDHHMWRKTYAYEGSSHIPFIVKLPAGFETFRKPGTTLSQPVELRDLLPTYIAINGGEQPEVMDGKSLLPLFTERHPEWREFIDLEHFRTYFKENSWCALTDGEVKYIYFTTTGEEQLFNLKKDPREEHNLAPEKKSQKLLEKMRAAMVEHLSERGEDWVKDGKLQIQENPILYGPNFPYEGNPYRRKWQ